MAGQAGHWSGPPCSCLAIIVELPAVVMQPVAVRQTSGAVGHKLGVDEVKVHTVLLCLDLPGCRDLLGRVHKK